ncbi:MAG: hypothetical protein M3Q39_02320, partial [Actinomycetota bacterium]|nr:hypothetical protein [Actinomycetota bacterium]
SADAAEWIANVVGDRCKNAELCLDPLWRIPRNGSYVRRRIMRVVGIDLKWGADIGPVNAA